MIIKIIILPHRVIIMSCVYLGWDGKKKKKMLPIGLKLPIPL